MVAAVLLASQWLALLHSVSHGRGAGPRSALAVAAMADAVAAAADTSWTWQALKAVTSHDEGSASCQLLDQLSQPAPAPALAAWAALPPAVAGGMEAGLAGPVQAGAAAYQPRAPPLLA